METNKYIVWVGGTPNYFNSLLEAQAEVLKWIDKGYDDIKTERIIHTIEKNNNYDDDYNKMGNIF
tara:strand:- start:13174 stop:13368 length:195 start_codon:yes stop_codon:yes gene_type:complete